MLGTAFRFRCKEGFVMEGFGCIRLGSLSLPFAFEKHLRNSCIFLPHPRDNPLWRSPLLFLQNSCQKMAKQTGLLLHFPPVTIPGNFPGIEVFALSLPTALKRRSERYRGITQQARFMSPHRLCFFSLFLFEKKRSQLSGKR